MTNSSKYTLRSLCREYVVEISILQRDYAQGRDDNRAKRVRENFVKHIVESLANGISIELDFVYGSVNDGRLTLLDGQQRLTTLWLLHWYVAARQGRVSEIKDTLLRFRYESRPSALAFCERLLQEEKLEGSPEDFQDKAWFNTLWNTDATVKGMMTMLLTIHKTMQTTVAPISLEQLWDDEALSFYFMPIEHFGMTDDIYIRMNARGKGLSKFEHFKSEFYKSIQAYPKQKLEQLKLKMEKEWVEALWPFRAEGKHVTDEAFMNLLAYINEMTHYAEKPEQEAELVKDKEGYDFKDLDFVKAHYANDENTDLLAFLLDHLTEISHIEHEKLIGSRSFSTVVTNIIKGNNNDINTDSRIVVYGALLYIRAHHAKADDAMLAEFIRVLRNLIVNTNDKSRREWKVILGSVKTLAAQRDVYAFMRTPEAAAIKGFYSEQLKEEMFKAKLFEIQPEAKHNIHPMEDHANLSGSIANLVHAEYPFKEIDKLDPNTVDVNKLQSIYDKYLEIAKNDFREVWGEMIVTPIYEYKWWNRRVQAKYYTFRDRPLFKLAKDFADSGKNLDDFLVEYEKERVNRYQAEAGGDLRNIVAPKRQLYLLYVITRRVVGKSLSDFFYNDCHNFALVDSKGHCHSLFAEIETAHPQREEGQKLAFHSYDKRLFVRHDFPKVYSIPAERGHEDTRLQRLKDLADWAAS